MAHVTQIQPLKETTLYFTIRGTSPLVMHAWSEKGLKMMRMTAAERKKEPKLARDPEAEAFGAAYYMDDGKTFGLPLTAIKGAICSAAHKDLGVPRTTVQKALFIPQTDNSGNIPLEYDNDPVIREDIVRVGANQTDLRYRLQFIGWRARVCMTIDENLLTPEDLMILVNRAGFSIGILEHRPEKGGDWGRFVLDESEAVNIGPMDVAA